MTEVGLVALAMTFVIITGGIDLSVGSILGLTAILLGVFWQNVGLPLPVAIVLALVVGTFAGFVNGAHHHPLPRAAADRDARTLALYRGLAEGISQARSVRGYPDWFFVLGQGEVLGVPTQLWILGARRARRRGHPRPTPPSAAPPTRSARTRWRRASPASASTAPSSPSTPPPASLRRSPAVIFVSRVSTTRSDMGTGLELDAITAVVLGGTRSSAAAARSSAPCSGSS